MSRIGDYVLLESLGDGNYGSFFKSPAPSRLGLDDEFVAVKLLAGHASDKDFRRMANELRVVATLSSDHLVEVYDAGHQGGRLFYAMAWYPEGSLADPKVELDLAARVRAVADAARGAHDLHEVGVVHRDIKPANIMIDEGRGRLSDLGLAQFLAPGMTTTGVGPIGSIEYMEPDIIWGERAARTSDVWSLGLTLHRVVAGEGVYGDIPENDVLGAFRHVLHQEPVLSAALPEEIRAVVARAVESERTARYPTAQEFADDVERAGRAL